MWLPWQICGSKWGSEESKDSCSSSLPQSWRLPKMVKSCNSSPWWNTKSGRKRPRTVRDGRSSTTKVLVPVQRQKPKTISARSKIIELISGPTSNILRSRNPDWENGRCEIVQLNYKTNAHWLHLLSGHTHSMLAWSKLQCWFMLNEMNVWNSNVHGCQVEGKQRKQAHWHGVQQGDVPMIARPGWTNTRLWIEIVKNDETQMKKWKNAHKLWEH